MGWGERFVAVVAGIFVVAGVSVLVARSDTSMIRGQATVSTPAPTPLRVRATPAPATPKPTAEPKVKEESVVVGAVTTTGLASLRLAPALDAKTLGRIPPGYLLSVLGRQGDFFLVFTPHERRGWVHTSKVKTHARSTVAKVTRLEDATIVLDPGHGGDQPGAVGKRGLRETDANVGIAKRIPPLLKGARVFVTNTGQHAGLAYRASLANKLGAHVFVSVHNNALPDRLSKHPGTEVYYSRVPGSKRLAGLLYEELVKVLRRHHIKWGRDPFAGAKYRLSHQHGGDYYAVLRRSFVPAVIVEGMFITNPAEERLLRTPRVRQDMAEAIARALRRFLTSGAPGSGFVDPYAKPTPGCKIPGCFESRR